jgi:hypothetical protein
MQFVDGSSKLGFHEVDREAEVVVSPICVGSHGPFLGLRWIPSRCSNASTRSRRRSAASREWVMNMKSSMYGSIRGQRQRMLRRNLLVGL